MRYKDIKIAESRQLDEFKMSPSNLSKLAQKIDAQAGIEFEMIVPDLYTGNDRPD